MIKVNSKVIIKGLHTTVFFGTGNEPVSESFKLEQDKIMIVEGLYHENQFGIWNINEDKTVR